MEILQPCLKARAKLSPPGHTINHITPPEAKGAEVPSDERVGAVHGHGLATRAAALGFARDGAGPTPSPSASPAVPREPHSEMPLLSFPTLTSHTSPNTEPVHPHTQDLPATPVRQSLLTAEAAFSQGVCVCVCVCTLVGAGPRGFTALQWFSNFSAHQNDLGAYLIQISVPAPRF